MASDVGSNPQTTAAAAESKSARKKKAKAEAAAAVPASREKPSSDLGADVSDPAGKANGLDNEHAYVKELQKTIRGVTKKLNAMQKVDAILDANPGVSLDDLVSSRKINNDQKAQALKKPALQAQLVQLEEQVAQYKKFDLEYQQRIAQEKELLQQSHSEELEKLRQVLKAEAALEQKKAFRDKFLTLSRFLRAAAARRQLEDNDSDLTKAFEGALLLVYGGDASAVAAAEKLIDGSDDNVPSTEGITLSITYGQIKQAALEEAPFAAEEAWVDEVAQSGAAPPETEASVVSTDPTLVNAGLSEINAGVPSFNGNADLASTPSAPAATAVDTGAANAAAAEHWDKQPSGSDDPLAESFEIVPRDLTETETPHATAPVSSIQSWADDTPESQSTPTPAAGNGNDGFHEVVHHNRGGRGRGGPHGEGRGGYRGRGGPRGDHRGGRGRGRGRGDFRGDHRGGPRGGGFRGGARGGAEAS